MEKRMRIVGGRFRGKSITAPSSSSVIRPTCDRVRESIFNILEAGFDISFEGMRVLDLFAGTGALGLEALSRGASMAVFIEKSLEARGIIRMNIERLCLTGVTRILRRDATQPGLLRKEPFDLVFSDPPYGQGLGEKAFTAAFAGGWFHNKTIFVLEERRDAVVDLPVEFCLQDERRYSSTVIRFYTFSG